MEKVREPTGAQSDTWYCIRCKKHHCCNCVESHEVDFDVKDTPEGHNEIDKHWKGEEVCPWCYNQLVDLHKLN